MHLIKPNFEDLIQNHMYCLTAEGRSQKTIDWYAANLKRFLRFLKSRNMSASVKDISITEVRRLVHHLQNEVVRWEDQPNIRDSGRLSPFSVQGYVRTIKAFWFWLKREKFIADNPFEQVKPPDATERIVEPLTPADVSKLLKVIPRQEYTGYRDCCVIIVMYGTGLRISEIVDLFKSNVDFEL